MTAPGETRVDAINPVVDGTAADAEKKTAASAVTRANPAMGAESERPAPVETRSEPVILVEQNTASREFGIPVSGESGAGPELAERPGSNASGPAAAHTDTAAPTGLTAQRGEPAKPAPNPKVESLYRAPPEASPDDARSSSGVSGSARQREGSAFFRAQGITELSLSLRHRIPSLKYNEHMPAQRSTDRHVVLNGNLYREGDTIAGGLVLIEISEPGIVLEYDGERFRLDAYNSWINFQ